MREKHVIKVRIRDLLDRVETEFIAAEERHDNAIVMFERIDDLRKNQPMEERLANYYIDGQQAVRSRHEVLEVVIKTRDEVRQWVRWYGILAGEDPEKRMKLTHEDMVFFGLLTTPAIREQVLEAREQEDLETIGDQPSDEEIEKKAEAIREAATIRAKLGPPVPAFGGNDE